MDISWLGCGRCCGGGREDSLADPNLQAQYVNDEPVLQPELEEAPVAEAAQVIQEIVEKKDKTSVKRTESKPKKEKDREKIAQERMAAAKAKLEQEQADAEALRLRHLGDLGKPGAVLQVLLDTTWEDTPEDESKQIRDHVGGGETKFAIQARGAMYIVDWSDPKCPTQTNARSGKARQLRVYLPYG
eukprot:CAMPEP_0170569048 /NCGR_PEP_ID=MMETSP0224-20130122/318_1 /TAXON_ID=285029 /ORGANISM="Togula jolla, Strain CCCM 725" /LENGTH=186 /DNA_ID=CAMNT_0010891131 /DNA_START=88 /DNA_END=648 /DNA_ORIENTATION=-